MPVEDYSPVRAMAAVNALHPLGKKEALEQIVVYLENRNQYPVAIGLLWVLRVLFELPDGQHFPPVHISQPGIPPPADPGVLPRFPIVMARDIPFLALSGYLLGDLPKSVVTHVAYYWMHGIFRKQPLVLPTSLDGIEQEFFQRWDLAYGDAHASRVLATIKAQIARLGQDCAGPVPQFQVPVVTRSCGARRGNSLED